MTNIFGSNFPILLVIFAGLFIILKFSGLDMPRWRMFLDSLDTNGGHVVTLFILLMIGWRMFQFDATAGGSIMTLSSGAILAMMKSDRTNKSESDRIPPVDPPVVVTPVTPQEQKA